MIYNEDCLDTMSRMDNGCIDLTITSPPYDNLRKYNGYSFDFESIAKELYRVIKPGGVLVWVVGDATIKGSETGTSFRQALYFKELGFRLHDTMIYAKRNPIPLTHNRYEQAFEYMFVFSKGKPNVANVLLEDKIHLSAKPGNFYKKSSDAVTTKHSSLSSKSKKQRSNIWTYTVGHNYTKNPAVYPYNLAKDHILSWSKEADTVYDPFMGSGTTARAAKDSNRQYIGSEISTEYYLDSIKTLGEGKS